MDFLKPIIWKLTNDPYWVGPRAHQTRFLWKKPYVAQTDCGFRVKYTLSCLADKIDHEQFRAARMLEEQNQRELVDDWHSTVFQPKFRELRCSFKYLSPWNEFDNGNPCMCRTVKEAEGDFIFWDFHCHEFASELGALPPMAKNGCRIKFLSIDLERGEELIKDGALIKENYNMIKVRGLETPENSKAFRKWEETVVIAMLNRQVQLEQEFQHIQTTQEHKSVSITIKMRLVGGVVELSWNAERHNEGKCVLRGYRKEEGFVTDDEGLSANGMCIVETQNSTGKAVQNLKEGKEYFFAFLITREDPVYEAQTFAQSLLSSPDIKGMRTTIVDSLRFSLRVPTRAEMMRVDGMLEKLKTPPPPDPKREKINRAFEELSTFVEFDESLTQWEDHFLKQIESRDYPDEEKRDKIDKLKSVVESLRIQSMP